MNQHFRAPTGELPEWIAVKDDVLSLFSSHIRGTDLIVYTRAEAEALLEVLLDICPNAYSLAHSFIIERDKAEYMKGGRDVSNKRDCGEGCADDDSADERDDSPYCECGNIPDEEEDAFNRCSACGKRLDP